MGTERTLKAVAPLNTVELAVANWIDRYTSTATRSAYRIHIRKWLEHCETAGLDPLEVTRLDIERWSRQLQAVHADSSVATRLHALASFYSYVVDDGLLDRTPMTGVRVPKVPYEGRTRALTRTQVADFIAAAEDCGDPYRRALAYLLAFNGMRVSEACGIHLEDLGTETGYHTVQVTRKGGKVQKLPLFARTAWVVELARADRETGPLLLNTLGRPMDAKAAWRAVRALGHAAGIPGRVHPHMLRTSFVTLSLDAGVSERDVMLSTGHASLSMVTFYDRARNRLDRNATHTLGPYVLGAA